MRLRWNSTGLVESFPNHDTGIAAVLDLLANGFILGIDFRIE